MSQEKHLVQDTMPALATVIFFQLGVFDVSQTDIGCLQGFANAGMRILDPTDVKPFRLYHTLVQVAEKDLALETMCCAHASSLPFVDP